MEDSISWGSAVQDGNSHILLDRATIGGAVKVGCRWDSFAGLWGSDLHRWWLEYRWEYSIDGQGLLWSPGWGVRETQLSMSVVTKMVHFKPQISLLDEQT